MAKFFSLLRNARLDQCFFDFPRQIQQLQEIQVWVDLVDHFCDTEHGELEIVHRSLKSIVNLKVDT